MYSVWIASQQSARRPTSSRSSKRTARPRRPSHQRVIMCPLYVHNVVDRGAKSPLPIRFLFTPSYITYYCMYRPALPLLNTHSRVPRTFTFCLSPSKPSNPAPAIGSLLAKPPTTVVAGAAQIAPELGALPSAAWGTGTVRLVDRSQGERA
jgi:hypothetical protein